MEEKIISLKHAQLRKRDEKMDARNKRERSIDVFLEEILGWYCSTDIKEQPEFVRIAREIDEIGTNAWLLENAEEEGLIEKRDEKWTDI